MLYCFSQILFIIKMKLGDIFVESHAKMKKTEDWSTSSPF